MANEQNPVSSPHPKNQGAAQSHDTRQKNRARRRGTGSIWKPKDSPFFYISWYENGVQKTRSSKSIQRSVAQAQLNDVLVRVRQGISARVDQVRFAELAGDLLAEYRAEDRATVHDAMIRLSLHLCPFFDCTVVEPRRQAKQMRLEARAALERALEESGGDCTSSAVRLARVALAEAKKKEMATPRTISFNGGVRACRISNADAARYTEHRRAQGASDSTIGNELNLLKKLLRVAYENDKLARVPHISTPPEGQPRRGFIEHEQFRTLLLALPEYLRPLISVAFFTGMRKGELLDLTWDRVCFAPHPHLRLEAEHTKTNRGRLVPLGGEALELLRMQKQLRDSRYSDCPFVFFRAANRNERRKPAWRQVQDFRRAWLKATEAVGLPELLVHDLRRSAVRNLIRSGVSPTVAQAISGHRSADVFRRYNVTSEADLHAAAKKLEAYLTATPVPQQPDQSVGHIPERELVN